MAKLPNEPLLRLELVALALAHAGGSDSDAGDEIPQRIWDQLHERNLITSVGEPYRTDTADTTAAGDAALLEQIEYLAATGLS